MISAQRLLAALKRNWVIATVTTGCIGWMLAVEWIWPNGLQG